MPDNMTLSWIAFAIGFFYVAGGVLVMRQLALEAVVDEALEMLGGRDSAQERLRTRILTIGAALTFASGLSLMALSRSAPAIFACAALLHGGYLVWAARVFPPQDPYEAQGRRATIRAFLFFFVAFAFVLYAGRRGVWREWLEPAFLELAAVAVLAAGVAWLFQHPARRKAAPDIAPAGDGRTAGETPGPPRPERLRLAPEYRCWPTFDDETGVPVDPADLGLGEELVERIRSWDDRYQATYDHDDPARSAFPSIEVEREWVKEGRAIAEALAREWKGPLKIGISALDMLVKQAHRGLSFYQPASDERVAEAAGQCGVAEIEEIIERLDTLAREKDALPQWDGDSSDDISDGQKFFARVLAAVAPRYEAELRRGLESPEDQTRAWVEIALQWRRERLEGVPPERGDDAAR